MTDVPSFSLRSKTVVQVGGSGLVGAALVGALSGAGARLVVATRNRASLERALPDARPPGLRVEEVDLSDPAALAAFRGRIVGAVDGLVFNAVSRPMHGMGDDLESWRASLEVNATGFFSVMRAFGDSMAERGSGSMVAIASQMGMVGMNPWLYEAEGTRPPPDYFFHKAGMINLARYLAAHYGPSGVRVNTVSPGGVFNPAQPPSPAFVERYGEMTLLGRMARAEEIVGAVIYLLSDASTYVTGANLVVDGGYTAK